MIPDYFVFIRYTDKRAILFFYLVIGIVLGFYLKNNNYLITNADAVYMSIILAIILFNFIYELKSYWAYSYTIKRVDLNSFAGKKCSTIERFISRPIVVSLLSIPVFWLIIYSYLLFSNLFYTLLCLFFSVPFLTYLIYRVVRPSYIKQVITLFESNIKYKNLAIYVMHYALMTLIINVLSVCSLKNNMDFSLNNGFFSARLIVAMFILCSVVLIINLAFSLLSKRYVFIGRLFTNEIGFNFSTSIPYQSLHEKSLVIRLLLLSVVSLSWIIAVSLLLTLANILIPFEGYFLICFIPYFVYYFLHLYWYWHNDFMTACDMILRYQVFNTHERNITSAVE